MVLEEEDLVDTILLKRAELDKKADCPRQRLFDDEILLASDLVGDIRSVHSMAGGGRHRRPTYSFQELEQVSPCLVGDGLGVNGLRGRMCCHYILKSMGDEQMEVGRLAARGGEVFGWCLRQNMM